MKKIIFGSNASTKEYSIDDLKYSVISFLHSNGISGNHASEYVSTHGNDALKFNFNCSNTNFTKAIGLLFLLSTFEKHFFISFRKEAIYLEVRALSSIEECVKHIEENISIKIINE